MNMWVPLNARSEFAKFSPPAPGGAEALGAYGCGAPAGAVAVGTAVGAGAWGVALPARSPGIARPRVLRIEEAFRTRPRRHQLHAARGDAGIRRPGFRLMRGSFGSAGFCCATPVATMTMPQIPQSQCL